eukprot:TRINITY_DN5763_c0_g3_i1.p1 TRINITY_DN5763_c0_g3~~TRINITY_DN5763_c0_g3_i1.p1  ORF type:complete len:661 (-),score=161.46 TRINITY_DN5763_c0_g3_i1:287-2269(-)
MRSSMTTRFPCGGVVFSLLASIFCAVLLFSSSVSCYKPPSSTNTDGGESEQQSTPHFLDSNNVHIVATRWAIDLLEADGQSFEAHATLKKYFDTLVQGLREAETSGGEFSLRRTAKQDSSDDDSLAEERTFHRNTFGHFVDVQEATPQGLEFSDAVNDETLAEILPAAGKKEPRDVSASLVQDEWKLDAARGPNVALTDLIDWHYALAVSHMKEGEVMKAILNLGYVAHFVQDATVPQRASKDFWLQSEAHLIAYERECEELLRNKEIAPPSEGGIYKTTAEWKPHDYVKFAAASAVPFAKSFLESSDFNTTNAFLVANELVPLSAKLTAGLFIRFFYGWYTERFTLIALSIDQVQAAIEKASLYPTATIGDEDSSRAQRRASISLGSSEINPNEGFASYGWVWTRWIDQSDYMEAVRRSNIKESLSEQEDDYDVIDEPWIPITIELRNRNDANLQLDISPDAGDKTLKLRYGLTTGHIWLCYHLYPNPSVRPTLKKLKNNHSEQSFFNMLRNKSKEFYEHFSFDVQGTTESEDDDTHSARLQLSIARFPKVQTGLTIGKKLGLITAAVTSLSMAVLALVVIVYTRRKEATSAVTTQADWSLLPSSASLSSSSSSLEDSTSVDPLWPQHLFAVLSERDLLIEDLQEQDSSQQYHHQYYIV